MGVRLKLPTTGPDAGKTAQREASSRADIDPTAKPWFVYIVRCADNTLYTGISNDVAARIQRHNTGQGAKYTRSRRPVRLVYREAAGSRAAAQQREHAIRKLKPRAKRQLQNDMPDSGPC
jgi:putative endonuclease